MAFEIRPYASPRKSHAPTRPLTHEETAAVPPNPPPISVPKDRTPKTQAERRRKTKVIKAQKERTASIPHMKTPANVSLNTPAPAIEAKAYQIMERMGTGASLPCEKYPYPFLMRASAEVRLMNRAEYWLNEGYIVTWHDNQSWFDATCEEKPAVFCVLTEAE